MEIPSPEICTYVVLGIAGIVLIVHGLRLHFSNKKEEKHFEEREDKLRQRMDGVLKKKDELEKKREQLRQDGEKDDDLDWRIDDINWRIDDLEWAIGDTTWEKDDRLHQQRTTKATFWTVLGAAILALASLAFCIVPKLLKLVGVE